MGTIYAGAAAPFCFSEERFLTPFPFSLSIPTFAVQFTKSGFSSLFLQREKKSIREEKKKGLLENELTHRLIPRSVHVSFLNFFCFYFWL